MFNTCVVMWRQFFQIINRMYEDLIEDCQPNTVDDMEACLSPLQEVGNITLMERIKKACTANGPAKRLEISEAMFIIKMNIESICEGLLFKFLVDQMMFG